MRRLIAVPAASVAALVLAACGGGAASSGSGSSSTASTPNAAASGPAVGSYQEAQSAVVQFVADGELIDPTTGTSQTGGWSGSGFIIDPSGIAVTNAHVAEGAATLKAYVGGSQTPVVAKILGISECNDLAVVQLTGTQSFPALAWADKDPSAGQQVWAAGFPLGDKEYHIIPGNIESNHVNGNTEWAALDYRLQMSNPIQHGNSGGPLLSDDGKVVGIDYALVAGSDQQAQQYFAIPAAVAKPIVDVLKGGKDQDSIGINGQAFYDDASKTAGIFVSGVRSGSAASDTGVKPGDIILQMEGRDVVTNADMNTSNGQTSVTKAGYCDVLRTHANSAIKLQVFRPSTGEVLEGEVNNADRPLTAISQMQATGASESAAPSSDAGGAASGGFTTVTDDTGAITVDMPTEWSDVVTKGTDQYAYVSATPDRAAFTGNSGVGVEYYVYSGDLASSKLETLMKKIEADKTIAPILKSCAHRAGGKAQDGDGYSFVGNTYDSCGPNGDLAIYLSLRTYPSVGKYVLLDAQYKTDQDVSYLNRSLGSVSLK